GDGERDLDRCLARLDPAGQLRQPQQLDEQLAVHRAAGRLAPRGRRRRVRSERHGRGSRCGLLQERVAVHGGHVGGRQLRQHSCDLGVAGHLPGCGRLPGAGRMAELGRQPQLERLRPVCVVAGCALGGQLMRARRFLAAVATAALVLAGVAASPSAATGTGWTASAGVAEAYAPTSGGWGGTGGQTLRMPVRTSLGGSQLRVRLTNRYATSATAIGHVTIGLQQGGANTTGAPVTVTFGGSQALTMAAGGSAVSDPVALSVAANSRLLLSVYIPPGANALPPRHDLADATGYNYNGGDASAASVFPVGNTFSFVAIFDGLDVSAAAPSTVVVVGDSISDGLNLAADSDTRWPDRLAARVAPLGLAV